MPVPETIRLVKRPINTVIDDNNRDGPLRYAVRERAGTKYVPGKNPQPRNGRVIGHIIADKFVPIIKKTANEPEILSYGTAALVKSVTHDLLCDLLNIYPAQDTYAIMTIATLRVIKPSIKANRISTHYKRTFVCIDYPGAALSPNTITPSATTRTRWKQTQTILPKTHRKSQRRSSYRNRRNTKTGHKHGKRPIRLLLQSTGEGIQRSIGAICV